MSKFAALIKGDVRQALWLALGWQIALLIVGVLIAPQQGLYGHMNHWDAGWYLHIIEQQYGLEGSPAAPAFYPLFPFVISALQTLTFGLVSPLFLALIVNTLALWSALIALMRILAHFKVGRAGITLGVAGFLAFPSAFFMHVFYSEALFIAIAFWAYLSALQKKWWRVGVLLAALTAARLPSLLFVALCGLEYLRAYSWNVKKALNKNILWFLLAPIGLLAYGAYLAAKRGDFLAMFHAYDTTTDWTYQVFDPNIFATLGQAFVKIIDSLGMGRFNYEIFVNYTLPLAAIVAVVTASIYVLMKLGKNGIPLFVFGVLAIILFTLNSNVVSVHRYALACVVIFVAVGLLARHKAARPAVGAAILTSIPVQLFLYSRFINDVFAG